MQVIADADLSTKADPIIHLWQKQIQLKFILNIKDYCKLHVLKIMTAITQSVILLFAGYYKPSIRT